MAKSCCQEEKAVKNLERILNAAWSTSVLPIRTSLLASLDSVYYRMSKKDPRNLNPRAVTEAEGIIRKTKARTANELFAKLKKRALSAEKYAGNGRYGIDGTPGTGQLPHQLGCVYRWMDGTEVLVAKTIEYYGSECACFLPKNHPLIVNAHEYGPGARGEQTGEIIVRANANYWALANCANTLITEKRDLLPKHYCVAGSLSIPMKKEQPDKVRIPFDENNEYLHKVLARLSKDLSLVRVLGSHPVVQKRRYLSVDSWDHSANSGVELRLGWTTGPGFSGGIHYHWLLFEDPTEMGKVKVASYWDAKKKKGFEKAKEEYDEFERRIIDEVALEYLSPSGLDTIRHRIYNLTLYGVNKHNGEVKIIMVTVPELHSELEQLHRD